MRLFLLFALVIAFLAIVFALQNNTLISINLFSRQYRYSLAIVLLVTLAIGVLIGLLFSLPPLIRRGWRSGRLQRQSDELVAQLNQHKHQLQAQGQKVEAIRASYRDLLEAIDVLEPITGLLRQGLMERVVTALLKSMPPHPASDGIQSLCLLHLQLVLAKPSETAPSLQEVKAIWQAAGEVLRAHATADAWLYGDGAGLFFLTVPGLDMAGASEYGEALRKAFIKVPLTLQDGHQVPLDINIGGAIALGEQPVTAATLISTARSALEQAQQGRNRLRLLQATAT